MKFITEDAQAQIVDDLAEAVIDGVIERSSVPATIKAFSEANDIAIQDIDEMVEEVDVVIGVVEAIERGLTVEDACVELKLSEKMVKKVSVADRKAGGSLISKKKDRKTRARKASQTTGLSKSKRQKTARKAAKTRKRQKGTSVDRKAKKTRAKSMKKRKQMGL